MIAGDIERVREALHFIPASDRDTWWRMGMAIKSELGDTGFDVWETWSEQDESFDPKVARDVWKSIRSAGRVTAGTLFHEAKAHGWRDDGTHQRPTPEELAARRREAAERVAKEAAEIARERTEAAKKAATLWKLATPANGDHPYLLRKHVLPVSTLREIEASVAAVILGYVPKSGSDQLAGRLLVAPVKVGDGLSTCELIDGDGRKSAIAGGSKAGGYWAAQALPEGCGGGLTFQYGEGVATTLSAKEATGHISVAALSAANLPALAKAMHQRYPAALHVILADLVKATGEPDPHATAAARSVGGRVAIPDFGINRPDGATDFNDMHRHCGLEAVQLAIGNASAPASRQDKTHTERATAMDGASAGWPEPQPLAMKVGSEPYPVDALPDPIRAAVEEVAGFVKAPLPLVAASALAALSVAAQAQIDAKRAERLQGPVGLFLLTIADSGERKSTCDGIFVSAIRQYQEEQAEVAKPVLKDHQAASEAWEAKRGGVKDKIRQLAKENKSTASMESALRDLEHDKPEAPRIPRLLYTDATPEALAYGLAKQWPSGGVVSAEAGIVFGSHGMGKDSVMRNLGLLNQLWDGASLTIDRRSTESFTVRGARLTVALQVQEPTLREFFTRSGALARGTGFLARFLVAWPESTQGFRPFTEAPPNWPHLASFNQRIAAILNQPVPIDDDGALTPTMLPLTPEAKAAWVEFHNAIECELASGGELYDVRDVASKSADNAVRLAALFQTFDGAGGAIRAQAFEGASRIAAWHLNEARRFFGALAQPAELVDAARLDAWLIAYCQRERTKLVPIAKLQQGGPGGLRSKATIDIAMRELAEAGRARRVQDGKRKMIAVNPALLIDGDAS
jgi:putative DNA primase/helicase